MQRAITGFRRDELSDWVAELCCGHSQHLRHNPPFSVREWVLSEEGRSGRLGSELDCPLCDRREMPAGFGPYQKTKVFDEASIPAGLLAHHHTKAGVWALIHVSAGALEYVVPGAGGSVALLHPGQPGVVVAEVEHFVRPCGPVSFVVEFWRASVASATPVSQ